MVWTSRSVLLCVCALCLWAAPSACGQAERLCEAALRQLRGNAAHQYIVLEFAEGIEWTKVTPDGPLPTTGNRAQVKVDADGRYHVATESWQKVDGVAVLMNANQSCWTGEQAFFVQTKANRHQYVGASEEEEDRYAYGFSHFGQVFSGFSMGLEDSLVRILSEGVPDARYGREGDRERLTFRAGGGEFTLLFVGDRLVGWTSEWRNGDSFSGRTIPYDWDGRGRNMFQGFSFSVRFDDFRPTTLGTEMPYAATIDRVIRTTEVPNGRSTHEIRRWNLVPLEDAGPEAFLPVGLPENSAIVHLRDTNPTRYVWQQGRAEVDSLDRIGNQIDAVLAPHLDVHDLRRPPSLLRMPTTWFLTSGVLLVAIGLALLWYRNFRRTAG